MKSHTIEMNGKSIDLVVHQLSSIIPYVNNPKEHPQVQLKAVAKSMDKFGFKQPIVIDKDGIIVAGHARFSAAKALKYKEILCVSAADLTEEEINAYRILDNEIAKQGSINIDILNLELAKIPDFDFSEFNIDFPKIELFNEGLCDEDEVPAIVEKPITQLGDKWILGNHSLVCGDSTSINDFEKLINNKDMNFCFTSPPYADQRDYSGNLVLEENHLATFIRTSFNFCDLYAVNLGISRKDHAINRYWDAYIKEAESCELKLLSWNVWDKGEAGSIGNQTAMFAITHEFVFIFGEGKKSLNKTVRNKSAGELANHNGNRQKDGSVKKQKDRIVSDYSQMKTVLQCSAQKARDEINHPARFPVEFAEKYILSCTKPNNLVYDSFGGSGSTIIACEKTNRNCYMMELSENYCDVIIKRWQKFTGKEAILESSGKKFKEVANESLS